MKTLSQHIILRMASVLGLLLMSAACSSGSSEATPPAGRTVMLGLTTEVLGSARTDSETPDCEKMSTLRIVVLHPDGSVEHNRFIDFGSAMQSEYTRFLEVRPNEKKSIWLIANENSVSSDLHAALEAYTAGKQGFGEAVGDLSFVLDPARPLPMTSFYEVQTGETDMECRFFLVRTAAKFTFRFTNRRSGAVAVNSIAVSDIAEESYLMPHKIAPTMTFRATEQSPLEELYWIDWLKRVSDESQLNPDDKSLADRRGWILDYDVPPTAHRSVTVQAPNDFRIAGLVYDMGVPRPGTAIFPAFFLPESKSLKAASGSYGEQEYFMTLTMTDSNNETKTFRCPFDNLKSLFRNTHVTVDISLNEKGIQVDVIPYSEVVLRPEFGL